MDNLARKRTFPDAATLQVFAPPQGEYQLNPQLARKLLKVMLTSRQADLREHSLMRQGKGWFHIPAMGHEAFAALALHMQQHDYCFPMYRDRSLVLARGMTNLDLAREFFATRNSQNGGRQLPGHYNHRALNIWSHPSPSGSHLLPACGVAWGLKRDSSDGIVVVTIGDAATRQGDFYEALCIAKEHQLPIMFVVEDNGFGISTRTRETNALAMRVLESASWVNVDARDPNTLYQVSGEMVASLRNGGGPGFLWCEVERLGGHTSNDDHRQYRSDQELEAIQDADPLARFKRRLLAEQIVSSAEIEQLERDVRRDVRADYEQAASEAAPQASETLLHVVGDSAVPPSCPVKLAGEATIADAVKSTFRAALAEDDRFVFFGEDIEDPKGGVFKITEGLSTEFPGRVVNSPLAESTITGMACGLASYGKRPVFELQFIDFAASGWNQIVNNLATLRWRSNGKWSCPSVIYAPYGGYLPGGAIWHSQANESALAHFPGLTIAIPSTPEDTVGMFWTAMHGEDPVIILLPKHLLRKPQVTQAIAPVELGKARVVRQGTDVTIVAWGNAVELATQAAEELDPEISADVIDLRSIVPWDREAVCESIEKTGRLVVVQEDSENCSVGQMVITDVLKDHAVWSRLLAPPQLVSKPNVLIGFHPNFEYAALPDTEQLVTAVKKTIGASARRELAPTPLPPAATPTAEVPAAAPPNSAHTPAPTSIDTPAAPETDQIQVVVPHLGEGIYNCDVVQLLKQAGESVESDEPICEIETDKATLAIEASHAGTLESWETVEGENLEVGQAIATIRLHGAPTKRSDVQPTSTNSIALTRAVQVPTASATSKIRWDVVKAACEQREANGSRVSPTAVTAFHLAEAFNTEAGQRFLHRAMPSYATERYFDLGIAVALPGDELTTAVVENPIGLSWQEFLSQYDAAIESARNGARHDRRRVALQLSTLGRLGIEDAHPLVVPPSAGTLFVGAAHWELIDINGQPQPQRVASLVISFDHRLINGVGAASLLNELKAAIEAAA